MTWQKPRARAAVLPPPSPFDAVRPEDKAPDLNAGPQGAAIGSLLCTLLGKLQDTSPLGCSQSCNLIRSPVAALPQARRQPSNHTLAAGWLQRTSLSHPSTAVTSPQPTPFMFIWRTALGQPDGRRGSALQGRGVRPCMPCPSPLEPMNEPAHIPPSAGPKIPYRRCGYT
ncbi:hypothetical protein GGTG_02698 [Gaeumannomyces tritici R3-111a-1]|uniref:Uncharacterized protein n=1 Tax=Gaeumannomyces tritici (strain R3-111a-1) TaxID=644352 RepID=J3NN40_GAET3|nr:hypothetical protein GGTG_02698 [Gaeumannomyces tritici R3-111a-1]EJT77592.1 hypothetical protein GGTG_02698 [Gaeumannomyces tritici R3-111a-1]